MIMPEELEGVPFLRELGEPHVQRVAQLARPQEYEQGAVLFRKGEDSPFIYVVLSGSVSLGVGRPGGDAGEAHVVGPGELVGWSPVLGRRAMTATARAATACRVAAVGVGQLRGLMEADPHFEAAFLRQIALTVSDRLAETRHRLVRALGSRALSAANVEGSD
jgi:CRP-like cAMP-binding protein